MSIDFFFSIKILSEIADQNFSHAEVCFFPKFQAKDFYTIRFLLSLGVLGVVNPMLRFYRGQSRQFRKESPVFLVPLANLSVHSTCHSDILTFDASLQLLKSKHRKKNTCFCWCLYLFFWFKKKRSPPTKTPTFSFRQKIWCLAQLASLCCCWPGIPWLERAAASQLH